MIEHKIADFHHDQLKRYRRKIAVKIEQMRTRFYFQKIGF